MKVSFLAHLVLLFIIDSRVTYAYRTEHREGSRRQFEHYQAEIKFLQTEWAGVEETADLILQYVVPNGSEAGVSCAWQERLKLVPDRPKAKVKRADFVGTVQALAMVKSHYPGVDLKRFEEGYTVDVDEAKLEGLTAEAGPTVESLVDMLDLEDL